MEVAILLLVWKRPNKTKLVINSIRGYKPKKIYISSDGPIKNDLKNKSLVKQVREVVLKEIDWECQIFTNFSRINKGCKIAVSDGINWFFNYEKEGIILEDDCLPSEEFYEFCSSLLKKYRFNKRIMAISGNGYQKNYSKEITSYFFSRYVDIWGWATWKRSWELYDRDIKNWNTIRNKKEFANIFEKKRHLKYWTKIFDNLFYNKKPDTWDYQWQYACFINSGLVCTPFVNLVENIGFGEEATHTKEMPINLRLNYKKIKKNILPLQHPKNISRSKSNDDYLETINYSGYPIQTLQGIKLLSKKIIMKLKTKKLIKKINPKIKRKFFLASLFLIEKTKSFLKKIFKIISIITSKTVDVNELLEKNKAFSKLIFKEQSFSLKQKKDICDKQFNFLPEGKHYIPEYRVYKFHNAIIKAGSNSIFSENGRLITGINFQDMPINFNIISNLKNLKINFFNCSILVLGVGEIENNYGHVWTELAARAYCAKISKLKFDLILIDFKKNYTIEILRLLDIPTNKIIYSSDYEYIQAKNIIYPELINNYKELFLNGMNIYHRKYLPFWMKDIYKNIGDKIEAKNDNLNQKIYIGRRNKNLRRIVNENELIVFLKELGFSIIYFEDYSVEDQIKLVKNAKYIVALHGAGLVNLNFCKEGTKILELFPHYYQCAYFYIFSNVMNFDYNYYIGNPVNQLWKIRPIMEDFYVEVNKIKKFLQIKWNF